jgi:hypothetical protein
MCRIRQFLQPARIWLLLAALLFAWNGFAASFASPLVVLHRNDGIQYQLLARNRLYGHYEMRDTGFTVRQEGSNPMWRPGLVWLDEGLARWLGSVRTASIVVSALGTTLLELAILWLAWVQGGWGAASVALVASLAPGVLAARFLQMAVGQGPEPWAAAALVVGLAILALAIERGSLVWAEVAGACAGLSELFRTGNVLLFAVPCAVLGVAALGRRDGRRFIPVLGAISVFLLTSTVCGWAVSSSVNKAAANIWGNLLEQQGPQQMQDLPNGQYTTCFGGFQIVPGTSDTFYDYIVRESRGVATKQFLADHASEIESLYRRRVGQVLAGGADGLRYTAGPLVLLLFGIAVLVLVVRLFRRGDAALSWKDISVLACAAGAVAHYLGPIVFFVGDQRTHYSYVILPLLVVVAARGAVELATATWNLFQRWFPTVAGWARERPWPLAALAGAPVACLALSFYHNALLHLDGLHKQAMAEQGALDALGLEGQRVACRDMSWFCDRDVETFMLPYASVPELEQYAAAHGLDGLLIWDDEALLLFSGTPYTTAEAFRQALQKSAMLGPPRISGGWRWYPVRGSAYPTWHVLCARLVAEIKRAYPAHRGR